METNHSNKFGAATSVDPVCGMTVNASAAKHTLVREGKTHFFCSQSCLDQFQNAPNRYLSEQSSQASPLVVLGDRGMSPSPRRVKDPVCKMDVDPKTAKYQITHEGETHFFCCGSCLEKFRSAPTKYLADATELQPNSAISIIGSPPTTRITDPGRSLSQPHYVCPMCAEVHETVPGPCPKCGMDLEPATILPRTQVSYSCPMHPEIVRPGPGNCPICCMALEPRTVTLTEPEKPELRDMLRRFWVSVVLTAPLLVIAMGSMMWPHGFMSSLSLNGRRIYDSAWQPWFELVLATPVVLWAGWPFFERGWASIVNRSTNMFTLIAMGTGVAYGYSVIATLFPGVFPSSFRSMSNRPDLYFEAAAAITTLVLLGQVLELRARTQTSSAIRALLDLTPKTARLLEADGTEHDIPLELVKPGDRL